MKDELKKCCICDVAYTGHGNNPDPVKETGRCCDECNAIFVIPARLKDIGKYMMWELK